MSFSTVTKCCFRFGVQVLVLSAIHFAGFVIGAQLAGVIPKTAKTSLAPAVTSPQQTEVREERIVQVSSADSASSKQAQQARMFGTLVFVCLLNSAVMVLWINQSSLAGFRLIGGSFFVFLFCMTIMPQSETYMFLRNSGAIIRMAAVMGLCVSGLFAISTVPVLGRWRQAAPHSNPFPDFTIPGILARLMFCSLAYVAVYLLFGYFVAWQNPELRELYGGSREQLLSFWELITNPPVSDRVIPLQIFRGFVWTLLCVGMIFVSAGHRWVLAITVALVLAVLMNSQLLLPNPVMSPNVRHAHMIETATSNFLFGVFCVLLWTSQFTKIDVQKNQNTDNLILDKV